MKSRISLLYSLLIVAAMLLSTACAPANQSVSAATPEPTPNTTPTPSPSPEPTATPVAEEEGAKPLFENAYIRIFFTGYSSDKGTLSFRVENLTVFPFYFMTPYDLSGDITDAEGFFLIDGAPHLTPPNSYCIVPAEGFTTHHITAVIGPESDGDYSIEALGADAKTAQFTADFLVCNRDRNVIFTVKLPQIDLADAAYFPLPNLLSFKAKTLSGEDIDGSYLSTHKLIMVNFWATWCLSYDSEMPDISALHTEYADKGFAVLGILVWDQGNEKRALSFLMNHGISYPVVAFDTDPLFEQLADTQQAIPFTIFFDSKGEQVGDVIEFSRNKADWADIIDKLLLQVG